jgi:hypothetical protein
MTPQELVQIEYAICRFNLGLRMNLSTYHRVSCRIFHNLAEVQTHVEGTSP